MKKILLLILQKLALNVIKKHKPFVIGITGTVGKTTATHFIYDFMRCLKGSSVYMSEFDYNGEFGIPLTILQSKSANKNIFLWLIIFIKGYLLLFSKNYPKYLILEYGIDHKGEMDFLLKIVKPDIAILLNISQNHVMQFPKFDDYIKEKLKLAQYSKQIIYNADDEILDNALSKKENVILYGVKNKNATVKAFKIQPNLDHLDFNLEYKSISYDLRYNLIGEYQVYNILPTFSLGILLGIEVEKIKEIFTDIHPLKGRGTLLKGVKESIIIDGSYNGGFTSISGGINHMHKLSDDYNKILFIGDMRELGNESKKMHIELASLIKTSNINYVVLVGEEMKKYVYEDLQEVFQDKVFSFLNSKKAGLKVREIIQQNDNQSVIFVKGSQNTIFLEEGIKEILFDLRDQDKLCRQQNHWLDKKEAFFNQALVD